MDSPADPSFDLEVERDQRTALGWAALLALIAVLWLAKPVGVGILLGAFLAFMAQPVYVRLAPRLGKRGGSIATVLATTMALAAVLGGLGWLFVAEGAVLGNRLIAAFSPGGVASGALDTLGRLTTKFGVPPDQLADRARGLVSEAAGRAAGVAEAIAATTGSALLGLLFAMLAMHYILCNWQLLTRRAQQTLPLRPDYTRALFVEFRRVGRTTLLGAIGTGIAQGVLATIGYWIAGLPEPAFFGAATFVASFVPAVGTLLVIVPAGVGLFLLGMPGHAIVELVWSFVVVIGVCDYVLRPRLTRGEGEVPALITFTALFGGIEVFGLKGLILGPVLMALALAVLRLYAEDTRARHEAAHDKLTNDVTPSELPP